MEQRGNVKFFSIQIFCISMLLATTLLPSCGARKSPHLFKEAIHFITVVTGSGATKEVKNSVNFPIDQPNVEPYGSRSPIALAPSESTPPLPTTKNSPLLCVSPTSAQHRPKSPPPLSILGHVPTPNAYAPGPNPSRYGSSTPKSFPSPHTMGPSPTKSPSSPFFNAPSPPKQVPAPFFNGPSPPTQVPSPPVVYTPPNTAPPSTGKGPYSGIWCVAKPAVPDPIMQAALDYACGSGADCSPIGPNGACYRPNTLLAHASYAFNNYWQKRKATGGTCDFGGVAMLVTVDPSFSECEFIYA